MNRRPLVLFVLIALGGLFGAPEATSQMGKPDVRIERAQMWSGDDSRGAIAGQQQDSLLDYLGRWGWGACRGVATQGNYALTGSGATVLWLDLTDSQHPTVAWETLAADVVGRFAIQDSIGYALVGGRSLMVIDLRHPATPLIAAELEIGCCLWGLEAQGPLVFLKMLYGSLYCVDASNPYSPYIRSVVHSGTQWATMALRGRNLYLGGPGDAFMEYLDVSNPDSILVTTLPFTMPPFIGCAWATDSLLLLGNHSDQVFLYSIAVPDSPVLRSSMSIPDLYAVSVTVRGDLAFVGTNSGLILTVDVSNTTSPSVLGSFAPAQFAPDVSALFLAPKDSTLLCSYRHGVLNLSVADPSQPVKLSFFPTGDSNTKIVVRKGTAYVTSAAGGLWSVDIADPSRPRRLGHLPIAGYAYDLAVDSTVGYLTVKDPLWTGVGVGWNGVVSVDLSRPDSLALLDSLSLEDPYALAKWDGLLFVTHRSESGAQPETALTVLDVSDPTDIRRVGAYLPGASDHDIAVRDSLAFVTGDAAVLRILDCSEPTHPQILSSVGVTSIGGRGLSITGNYVFVHGGNDSTYVVDVADPRVPQVVSRTQRSPDIWDGSVESMIAGQTLFWADRGGFGAMDISHPTQPRSIMEAAYARGSGISHCGDTIYLTDDQGFWVFRYKPGVSSVPASDLPGLTTLELLQNYPNPFNAATHIRFRTAIRQEVRIEVFDLAGRFIRNVFAGVVSAGEHAVCVDASRLPTGAYFLRLQSPRESRTRKILVLK